LSQHISCGPILIAEDDPAAAELVKSLLEAAGFRVAAAATGIEAVAAARRTRPSLVVLDVNLPGVSGYEVCRSLREQYGPELPIIFLSGDRIESYDRVAGLLIGGDDYVVKPFAPDELLARVRGLIGRRRSIRLRSDLTEREREVLQLLAEGLAQTDIADRLVISKKTVGTHIERILAKLGMHSRAEAVAFAYREELVAPA